MTKIVHCDGHRRHRASWSNHPCIICGSKAIGINFGAPTCAPCKGIRLFIYINFLLIYIILFLLKKLFFVVMHVEKK
jgi:hypothetical protein